MLDPRRIMEHCEALARHSELAGGLTRVFLSSEQRAANELVLGWTREAGMSARLDGIGNVSGRYEGAQPGLPCLMLGSHLDTVRDAGKYDGMLGVVTAIECVHALNAAKRRLPFAIEVLGFGDEEGVRFGSTLLGSRAVAGTFKTEVLDSVDANGISMRDALAGAAECVLAVERIAAGDPELVGTVGRIEASPGAINVIPGEVRFTVDVRAPKDALRESAITSIRSEIERVCGERKLNVKIESLQSQGVTHCAEWLMSQLDAALAAEGLPVRRLPSGAGHDGMALRAIADICMLFVRCKDGISHNPAEAITAADAETGARVFLRFIENFRTEAR